MPVCLWCHQRPIQAVSWETLFELGPRPGFCEQCEAELVRLKGARLCQKCGRDLDQLDDQFQVNGICLDCTKWQSTPFGQALYQNRSVYLYTPHLKDLLTQLKFRGDAILIEGFRRDLRKAYWAWYKWRLAIPIPLSAERQEERTFNQSELIADCLAAPKLLALVRSGSTEKQSKRTRQERLQKLKQESLPFSVVPEFSRHLKDRHLVLIDDIYTTGVTLRLAAQALLPYAPRSISSFTLARS
ncbi:ComF family protein [Pullulanibacillus sp. KACC 23026]|uniref:ComF family protein n=1 Tax=Pullulanibacillus sp. KACC 23026 TaxID=3028315 RepID=UPI0023AFE8B6|nr:ComF family protein [Pullulanibacillus sp. KACC 23026]WEG13594.1 ComF family protein [Pullulanibacillus sp. KACC 23026]